MRTEGTPSLDRCQSGPAADTGSRAADKNTVAELRLEAREELGEASSQVRVVPGPSRDCFRSGPVEAVAIVVEKLHIHRTWGDFL